MFKLLMMEKALPRKWQKENLVLDALHMIKNAWSKLSSTCIRNCFRKAALLMLKSPLEGEFEERIHIPADMTTADFDEWVNIDADLPHSQALDDIIAAVQNTHDENASDGSEEDEPEEELVS